MDTKDEVEKRPTTGNAAPRKEMVELTTRKMTKDEHHLATLGYKQVFIRSFGMFEDWAATFTTMNFVSGLPVLFGFAMYTGGPQAAFSNWTMVGGLSTIVSLAMAEIAAALPTAGGIYYWAYVLGGQEYAQGNTNFFVSMLEILYPNSAVHLLRGRGRSRSADHNPVLLTQEFYGYDASVHLSEETLSASSVVANGMWTGSISTWLLSVLTLIMPNNWAEYLVQLVGHRGAAAILAFTWIDGLLCTGVIFLSAQRITYAVARDGILPFSKTYSKVTPKHHLPVNAALLMVVLTIAICAAVIGSTVAFSAITAAATIGTNLSYLIPIVARQTIGRKHFKAAKWNFGAWSIPVSIIASLYIAFLFVVLMLPQLYPVNAQTLNYAPIVIGGITAIALGGWLFPFSLGARYWFEGPKRTISEVELVGVQVKGSD
ncbi:hypothetical protein KC351_g8116 [Hortaea werneckii]|nr:hypothetical protein KC351_g8116 [Hortaea werneckii]